MCKYREGASRRDLPAGSRLRVKWLHLHCQGSLALISWKYSAVSPLTIHAHRAELPIWSSVGLPTGGSQKCRVGLHVGMLLHGVTRYSHSLHLHATCFVLNFYQTPTSTHDRILTEPTVALSALTTLQGLIRFNLVSRHPSISSDRQPGHAKDSSAFNRTPSSISPAFKMHCQKCRQPLKLDSSLDDLNPAAYDLLVCMYCLSCYRERYTQLLITSSYSSNVIAASSDQALERATVSTPSTGAIAKVSLRQSLPECWRADIQAVPWRPAPR